MSVSDFNMIIEPIRKWWWLALIHTAIPCIFFRQWLESVESWKSAVTWHPPCWCSGRPVQTSHCLGLSLCLVLPSAWSAAAKHVFNWTKVSSLTWPVRNFPLVGSETLLCCLVQITGWSRSSTLHYVYLAEKCFESQATYNKCIQPCVCNSMCSRIIQLHQICWSSTFRNNQRYRDKV